MNIYFADDHKMVRDGIRILIKEAYPNSNFFEASSYPELLNFNINDHSDDLIIIDLKMPGMHGIESIKELRKQFAHILIMVLSGHFIKSDVQTAIHYGANAFVTKSSNSASLLSIINLIKSGENYIPPEIKQPYYGASSMSHKPETLINQALLTPRETEVLEYLSKGCPDKTIASKLGIQEGTLKSHIKSIYKKLKVNNRTQAAKYAIEHGLNDQVFG